MKTLAIIRRRREEQDRLAYIEDSRVGGLEYVARQASKAAIYRAKFHKRSITYLEHGWVVRELPDGRKIRVEKIKSNTKKRTAGARFQLA